MKLTQILISVLLSATNGLKLNQMDIEHTNPGHDVTGTYSPKENMHTGYEGSKTKLSKGTVNSWNFDTTGTHPSVTRLPESRDVLKDFRLGGSGNGKTGVINSDDTRGDMEHTR